MKKLIKKIINWWKHRNFNLRQACIDKYGEEFGNQYDSLCDGRPIGGLLETIKFLEKLEKVKKENGIQ